MLLLSSEPLPFNEKHKVLLQVMLPQTKIILVDGEMFSWYGSRLLKSAAYFETIITTNQEIIIFQLPAPNSLIKDSLFFIDGYPFIQSLTKDS